MCNCVFLLVRDRTSVIFCFTDCIAIAKEFRKFSQLKLINMKRHLLLIVLFMFSAQFLLAQSHPYNVVFDLTSKDTVSQMAVIRWINEIIKSNPNAKLEVVMYGQGTDLVVKDKSLVADDVTRLAQNKNVSFRVCAIAMRNHNIDKSRLLPGVDTVHDGIFEIVSKQGEGWGYIKIAH